MQYTVRGITAKLDSKVREEAEKYRVSLNSMLVEAIARGMGLNDAPAVFHDLDDLAGTWVEDDEFDRAMEAFEVVDEDLWR